MRGRPHASGEQRRRNFFCHSCNDISHPSQPLFLLYVLFCFACPSATAVETSCEGSVDMGREVSLAGRMAHGSHTKRPQNCHRGSKVNTAAANCEGLIKGVAAKYTPVPQKGSKVILPPGCAGGPQLTSHALNPRMTIPILPRFTGSEGPDGVIRKKEVDLATLLMC